MKNILAFSLFTLFSIYLPAQTIINSSTSINQANIDSYTWPVVIYDGTESNPVVITLTENISLYNANQYFIIQTAYVQFDGNNKIITINNITGYPGLIQNSLAEVTIRNTNVLSSASQLVDGGGWIGQEFFGNGVANVMMVNCYSNGNLSPQSGGITGQYSDCSVEDSHSSGTIGVNGGGIFGAFSNGAAINCYSTGEIGSGAGGIMGSSHSGTASDCYSTGNIGNFGGGIHGYGSNVDAVNCYSTGVISEDAGGIAGEMSSGTITNCYSAGVLQAGGNGITGPDYFGSFVNCYASVGNWSDLGAGSFLTGVGTTWKSAGANTPYLLSSFNEPLYNPDNGSISANASGSFSNGNFSDGTYSILGITGNPAGISSFSTNATTGVITVTNAVVGSYVLNMLYRHSTDQSYSFVNFPVQVMSVLPVSWLSFNVVPREAGSWVQWSTASEQHSHDYKVQHSINGRNWNNVATIVAAGNSSAVTKYSYLHADPVNGINYYRIQQTDRDGGFTFSAVKRLDIALKFKPFYVFNTVVTNGILQVNLKETSALYLFANDGKLIWQKRPGTGLQNIDMSTVAKGVYFLKANDAIEKIVVQ